MAISTIGRRLLKAELPTAERVRPVMKLRCGGPNVFTEGTAFAVAVPSWEYLLVTARHVVNVGVSWIQVQATTDAGLLRYFFAASFGAIASSDDASDFAVVALMRNLNFASTLGFDDAPSGDFDASLRGYGVGSSRLTDTALGCTNDDPLIRHSPGGEGGESGAPILADELAVGVHVRDGLGIVLDWDFLNAAMARAQKELP